MPSTQIEKANKKNDGIKKETEKRKIDIPSNFIKKIKKLGMKVEDAEILFKSKIDWAAVYSENKIYCAEPGCDFFTKIENDELTNHLKSVHKYRDYPCEEDYCDFVAVSQKHLNYHRKMHTMRFDTDFWFKCLKPNCKTTFRNQPDLDRHMRIHNNDVDICQFCPYPYVLSNNYADHLNKHFRMNDYTCDHCGLKFSTKKAMVLHSTLHEGIIYCCLICRTYEARNKNTIQVHLRKKHSDRLGKNIIWDDVKEHVELK